MIGIYMIKDAHDTKKRKGCDVKHRESGVPMEIFGKLVNGKKKNENKYTYIFIFLFIFHFWEDTLYTKYPIGS